MGIDGVIYGDKVINVRNTRWDHWYDAIYPKEMKSNALKYIANGEIGIITGVFSSKWQGDHPINVTFSSQPGYSYVFKRVSFYEEKESQLELAYCITISPMEV
jgi:ATP-dependent exoDNAse (exonuclease V) alpha subunit